MEDGISLINKALQKREEAKAWDLYVSMYPHMTKESYMAFDKFYSPQNLQKKQAAKSEGEILMEVRDILNSFRGGEQNRDI